MKIEQIKKYIFRNKITGMFWDGQSFNARFIEDAKRMDRNPGVIHTAWENVQEVDVSKLDAIEFTLTKLKASLDIILSDVCNRKDLFSQAGLVTLDGLIDHYAKLISRCQNAMQNVKGMIYTDVENLSDKQVETKQDLYAVKCTRIDNGETYYAWGTEQNPMPSFPKDKAEELIKQFSKLWGGRVRFQLEKVR